MADDIGSVAVGMQSDLFEKSDDLPEGFRYQPDVITVDEEGELVRQLETLSFQPFEFHGHIANRHIVRFGLRYDYRRRAVVEAAPIPEFLIPLRQRVAEVAGRPAAAFAQILINEYRQGAGIGWHRDKPQFEEIAGVSLLAPCNFRLRRRDGTKWNRKTVIVDPRSVYLMTGPSRNEWEHSIPPVNEHRYSITLRTVRVR